MRRRISHLDIFTTIQVIGWTLAVAMSLIWNIAGYRKQALDLTRQVAQTHIDKDILYRRWNALKGGIYVPVTAATPPNPYLDPSIVTERDVTTTNGLQLTLMNPAYMTRQVYEIAQKDQSIAGHLTSLNPIRPENIPDAWERAALQSFEQGAGDATDIITTGNKRYLRLMKPFTTEDNCLRCHRQQGYKLGDIRGGISVTVPLIPFESNMKRGITGLWIGHGSLWFLGILGIWAGSRSVKRHVDERNLVADELQAANTLLEHQATTDILTGICNRQKGIAVLINELERARRYKTKLCLMMFDIDHFKQINDSYGHDAGDRVLQGLAKALSSQVRGSDLLVRWGGEEFIVISPGTSREDGARFAEKLRSTIAGLTLHPQSVVTCSFGATYYRDDDTVETITKRADEAMYRAKHAGRNCAVFG